MRRARVVCASRANEIRADGCCVREYRTLLYVLYPVLVITYHYVKTSLAANT